MAETSHEKSSWGLFGWLTILFIIGNAVFANLFLQFMGFIGVPIGIGVSGSLTLMVFFILHQRNAKRRGGAREKYPGPAQRGGVKEKVGGRFDRGWKGLSVLSKVLFAVVAVAIIVLGPFVFIWAWNTLFGLGIPLNLWPWMTTIAIVITGLAARMGRGSSGAPLS